MNKKLEDIKKSFCKIQNFYKKYKTNNISYKKKKTSEGIKTYKAIKNLTKILKQKILTKHKTGEKSYEYFLN